MPTSPPSRIAAFLIALFALSLALKSSTADLDVSSLVYLWPLPTSFTYGTDTLAVDPALALDAGINTSEILTAAFDRYKKIIFKHRSSISRTELRGSWAVYDVSKLKVVVNSADEQLQLGVDESYSLYVAKSDGGLSIVGEATIEVF